MSKLTDTQLIILSAASRRDDRGVELPANIKGEAARKTVDKLIRAGLLEEVRAAGSLPVWRRDDESGPMALRITQNGLEAIDVEDAVDRFGQPEISNLLAAGDLVRVRAEDDAADPNGEFVMSREQYGWVLSSGGQGFRAGLDNDGTGRWVRDGNSLPVAGPKPVPWISP